MTKTTIVSSTRKKAKARECGQVHARLLHQGTALPELEKGYKNMHHFLFHGPKNNQIYL